MRKLKGGVIGCGFFARNHLYGWREVSGADIVALCDIDAHRLAERAKEFGIERAYEDAGHMFRSERLDFVDIITQPDSHHELVVLAARHGVPVICQKPMAETLEEARAMVEACHEAGVTFMVHENFRWQAPMRALKKAAEELGPLFFGRISFRSAFDIYAVQPYLMTGERFIISDLGVHLLDLARFFFGDIDRLTCQATRVNPKIKAEDVATILLETKLGATCIVEMSYASHLEVDVFPQTLVHLEGAAGSAVLKADYEQVVTTERGIRRSRAGPTLYDWLHPPNEVVESSVVPIQQHWVDCIKGGLVPETSGSDNLKTLDLVFGAYTSTSTGLPVHFGASM